MLDSRWVDFSADFSVDLSSEMGDLEDTRLLSAMLAVLGTSFLGDGTGSTRLAGELVALTTRFC